jgi:hypothetical protein
MAALTDEEAREAIRLLATAHEVLLGDPSKNPEGQPNWWSQYGRISSLTGRLDGPNGDLALAGLREIVGPYVQYHEQRLSGEESEGEQERPTE